MQAKWSFRLHLIGILLVISSAQQLRAQAAPHLQVLALQVKGMTAADRDALAIELDRTMTGKIVFACVPAGVILIEPAPDQSRSALRERTLPILRRHALKRDIKDTEMTLAQAEQRCAEARTR